MTDLNIYMYIVYAWHMSIYTWMPTWEMYTQLGPVRNI